MRKVIFDTDIGCDDALALIPLLLDDNIDFMITPSGLNSTESNSGKKNSGINKQKLI